MSERTVAPHVARAIGAVQAKKPAAPPGTALKAPHVAAALRPPARPATAASPPRSVPPPIQPSASRPPAPAHLLAALQRQAAPALQAPAAHLARAVMARPPALAAQPKAAAPPRAPHVAAALAGLQPKTVPGRLAALASHLRTGPADGVVQPSRDLAKRKEVIGRNVVTVNQQVEKDYGKKNFFVSQVTSFANEKVGITGLPTAELRLDRRQSQASNLAYLVKKHFKAKPEVQVSLLQNPQGERAQFLMSTNTGRSNRRIKKELPEKVARRNIKYFYKDSLREKNVRLRIRQLEIRARRNLKINELRGILSNAEKKQLANRKEFLAEVSWKIARQVHKQTRKDPERIRMKSVRGLAYSSRLGRLPLSITDNEDDVHSESDILNNVEKKKGWKIELVVGTKVPCLACQTMFRGKNVGEAILEHTSGAWMSKASMEQLGFKSSEIERYLRHIADVLDGVDLYQHDDPHGDIGIEHMTDLDSDPSSDSEDDEATGDFRYQEMGGTKRGDDLVSRIDELATTLYPRKKKSKKKKKKK